MSTCGKREEEAVKGKTQLDIQSSGEDRLHSASTHSGKELRSVLICADVSGQFRMSGKEGRAGLSESSLSENEPVQRVDLIGVNTCGPAVSASWQLLRRDSIPPQGCHKDRDTEATSFLMSAFQRSGFQILEKDMSQL